MRRLIPVSAFLLAIPLGARAQSPAPAAADRVVTVMTRNLYFGADLGPTITARSPSELVAAVTSVFATVQATDFPERAQALADEVARKEPDLIGLQEVVLWRSQFPADFSPAPNATTVEFDFLELLLAALAARGLRYAPVAISTGFDLEAPRLTPSGLQDIRLTDRDVILARTDLKTSELKLTHIMEGHFVRNLVLPTLAGPVTVRRGWASVDAKVRGKRFRFVTTHLERLSPSVQVAQAEELLSGPGDSGLSLLLVGDFNSKADGSGTATYGNLIAAGLIDVWAEAHPSEPGLTCCQAVDLRNDDTELTERIDLLLFRGEFGVRDVDIVGEEPDDRTASGLWPSDHAGVAATVTLPR